MNIHQTMFIIGLVLCTCHRITANGKIHAKRVTAERGSDLSLSCTFQEEDSDKTIVQWLYQNLSEPLSSTRSSKIHWRPLFINDQSLTPTETRYSIQQKIQPINSTSVAFSTILTLGKVEEADEGLYMCKSVSPRTIQMAYQVRVIESLDIHPKQIFLRADETTGEYSIRLNCILTDSHSGRRPHEIHWWHNNKRLGGPNNRQARIVRNSTQQSLISTLVYTGLASHIAGNYTCESDPLRRYIVVGIENQSTPTNISGYSFILTVMLSCYFAMVHA